MGDETSRPFERQILQAKAADAICSLLITLGGLSIAALSGWWSWWLMLALTVPIVTGLDWWLIRYRRRSGLYSHGQMKAEGMETARERAHDQ